MIPIHLWITSRTVSEEVQAKQWFFTWKREETRFYHFTTTFKSALEKVEKIKLYCKTLEKLFKCQSARSRSFGWRMIDGHFNIQWFDSDAAPTCGCCASVWRYTN